MKVMKHIIYSALLLTFVLSVPISVLAQEEETPQQEEKKKPRPARDAFESGEWFDGRTGKVYQKGTLEMVMNHRFGLVNAGRNDLFGIYGPSNIRLAFSYAPIEKLNVGFGYTKNNLILDLNAKYQILTQTRKNEMPISLTYFGTMGIECKNEDYANNSDRLTFFNQLILMRRFSSKFSAQIAPSFSHFNAVFWEQQDDGTWKHMENDTWGISAGLRYKVSSTFIIMGGYDQPLTQHEINQPKPSINFGVELTTSSHAFQVFVTNYNAIIPQYNFMNNQNDFTQGDFLIGFNITRLWSF